MDLNLATSSSLRGATMSESDSEDGSRPTEIFEPMSQGCGPVYTELTQNPDDLGVALPYVWPYATPKGNVKVDVSQDILETAYLMIYKTYTRDMWPSIYKVPKELKRGDKDEGYEPVAARIGPFAGNNNESTLQPESFKWRCVQQLIYGRRATTAARNRKKRTFRQDELSVGQLDLWLRSMKRHELQIRASYNGDIELSSDELALNMVLDGCFILQRLLTFARAGGKEAEGISQGYNSDWTQVIGRVWVWQLVATDLLLLENQIPFFVLRKLFKKLWSRDDEPEGALVKGSLKLFGSLCPYMLRSAHNSEADYHSVHLHHLLHLFYLPVVTRPTHHPQPSLGEGDNINHSGSGHPPAAAAAAAHVLLEWKPQWIPCAKELEEAGVRFRKNKKANSFLDIEFDSRTGVLKIPTLQLYDFSDKVFRNLIAFEQTHIGTGCNITTYAVFMDCLINTPEDLRILHLRGIIVNQINGEQDASRFFSNVCAQVRWSADDNYLKDVMNKVNDYRDYRPHKWRAALVRNYFSNPWVAMSVVAAVLLLFMTILQTFFTVYPYFYPPK